MIHLADPAAEADLAHRRHMRFIHTSDWHLGKTLFGRRRYAEFEAFLSWLAETVERRSADALLVAGDVFDTTSPSTRSQALYYRFLCRLAASNCRHVVVIGGNHDSPSFLNAPKELLSALNVHVVGCAAENLEDEVLVLRDARGEPELIVCAVPYLRDRDIRRAEAGESIEDKERKLIQGIRDHYSQVAEIAEHKREELQTAVPVVGMGHLFAAGGHSVEGDGVRELYVGSLAHVSAGIFPPIFEYLALGHLHGAQTVNAWGNIRYSGAPLPMGFAEAEREKSVCLVELAPAPARVEAIKVPVLQKLVQVSGTWDEISAGLLELSTAGSAAWLEVIYRGEDVLPDLRERLQAAIAGSALEILRVQNTRVIERALGRIHAEETLDDLHVDDVFQRCLAAHEVAEIQRPELLLAHAETVASLDENEQGAE